MIGRGALRGRLGLLLSCLVVGLSGCPKEAPPPAPTGGAGPAATAGDLTLTTELVEKWILSLDDAKVKAALGELRPGANVPMAEIADSIDQAGDDPGLSEAVKTHGFQDGTQWALATKRIYAGLIPMMIEGDKKQADKRVKDPAKIEEAEQALEQKIEETKAAFGELTDAEMKTVEDILGDASQAK